MPSCKYNLKWQSNNNQLILFSASKRVRLSYVLSFLIARKTHTSVLRMVDIRISNGVEIFRHVLLEVLTLLFYVLPRYRLTGGMKRVFPSLLIMTDVFHKISLNKFS